MQISSENAWHTTCNACAREEVAVTEDSRAVAAALVGAVIGGVAGYLLFTEHGRRLRRSIEPALEDIARELNSFRSTITRATSVASEGWKLLNEALGEGSQSAPRYPSPHQSSPF